MEDWVHDLILFLWQFPHCMAIAWMFRALLTVSLAPAAILAVDTNALRGPAPYRDLHRVDLRSPGPLDHFALQWIVHSPLRTLFARLLWCIALLMGLQSISMQGQSHISEPAVNLGDTSFLDGPAGPGVVAEQIGDAAHDGRMTDSAGNDVPGAGAVNSISGLAHIAWLSHKQVLGGWYGVEVVLSAAHVDAGALGEA